MGAGDTLVYSVTNPGGATKTVTLTLTARQPIRSTSFDPDNFGNVCFGAPAPFETNTGGQATQGPDGLFYGNLPLCDDQDGDNDNENGESGGNLVVPAGTFPCINFVNAQDGHLGDVHARVPRARRRPTPSHSPRLPSDPKAHG